MFIFITFETTVKNNFNVKKKKKKLVYDFEMTLKLLIRHVFKKEKKTETFILINHSA